MASQRICSMMCPAIEVRLFDLSHPACSFWRWVWCWPSFLSSGTSPECSDLSKMTSLSRMMSDCSLSTLWCSWSAPLGCMCSVCRSCPDPAFLYCRFHIIPMDSAGSLQGLKCLGHVCPVKNEEKKRDGEPLPFSCLLSLSPLLHWATCSHSHESFPNWTYLSSINIKTEQAD